MTEIPAPHWSSYLPSPWQDEGPDPDLAAALGDLTELSTRDDLASETVGMARDILRKMYDFAPYRYDVYSSSDGQVVIDATEDEISIVVFLSPEGSARCFVSMDGDQRRAWYGNGAMVFGWFMQEALLKLLTLTRQIRTWTMCWISTRPLQEAYSAAVISVPPPERFDTEPSLKPERYFQLTGAPMLPSNS